MRLPFAIGIGPSVKLPLRDGDRIIEFKHGRITTAITMWGECWRLLPLYERRPFPCEVILAWRVR